MNNPVGAQPVHRDVFYALPPDKLSLHLGHPNPSMFPQEAIWRASRRAFELFGGNSLQYAPELGMPQLRDIILNEYASHHPNLKTDNIVVTQGTSESLSLFSSAYVSASTLVLVENPSYPWALKIFEMLNGRLHHISSDEYGMVPSHLEDVLRAQRSRFERAVLYVMPNFQNPSGFRYTDERRQQIISLAVEYDLTLFEDDAYSRLYYGRYTDGNFLWTASRLGHAQRIIHAGTFSKVYGPGLRIGWMICNQEVAALFGKLKQTGACQYTSATIVALMENEYYGFNGGYLSKLRSHYKDSHDVLYNSFDIPALNSHQVSLTAALGGFYLWLTWPKSALDSMKLCTELARQDVLVMNGSICMDSDSRVAAIRLSFSYETPERLKKAGKLVQETLLYLLSQSR